MVSNTRAKDGPGALRALNLPQPIQVREEKERPVAVRLGRRWLSVAEVGEAWRLDDEWWRERAVSRMYFKAVLGDGAVVSIFKDLITISWYRQQM